jgi:ABC-2 type transport system ATP-binding protein
MDHGTIIALGTPRELIDSIGAGHVVEFSAGHAAQDVDVSAVGRLDGVSSVRTEDGSIWLNVTELHQALPALLGELSRQGVVLTELRTHSASLEDVFVTLAGRRLRDDGMS